MKENQTKHLKFFGIGKILPFLKKFRKQIAIMIFCGLCGSAVDIILPLYQRYALDHFIGEKIFDTIAVFIIAYLATIVFAGVSNYISCSLATIIEMRSTGSCGRRLFPTCRHCLFPISIKTASVTSMPG